MPGFGGKISPDHTFGESARAQDECPSTQGAIRRAPFSVFRNTVEKFLDDKVFGETGGLAIVIEGVVFNRAELQRKHDCRDFLATVHTMYEKLGETFFSEFRGSFCGCLFDYSESKFILFTSQIGDRQVYYSESAGTLHFGTNVSGVADSLRMSGSQLHLNVAAAYMTLSYGFQLETETLVAGIRKLEPGTFLTFVPTTTASPQVRRYHTLDNTPNSSLSMSDCIEEVDKRFRTAVDRQFSKDHECGFRHFAGLSGGLDSRMTTWVARDMGFSDIVNFTFCESDYLDERIAKQISNHLGTEWILKTLDGGSCLLDIDSITRITEGRIAYAGVAHLWSTLRLLDKESLGIIHTGQLGDVVVGTFVKRPPICQAKIGDGALSTKLLPKLEDLGYEVGADEELYKFYGRGLSGANQGMLIAQEFTESFSPFYDLDMLEFALSIPVEMRADHHLYAEWIRAKYPRAGRFIWEKTGVSPTSRRFRLLGRSVHAKDLFSQLPKMFLRKIGLLRPSRSTRQHMNPFDYWYSSNDRLRQTMDGYLDDHLALLAANPELQNDCVTLYRCGTAMEKAQVLTLLSAHKAIFQ